MVVFVYDIRDYEFVFKYDISIFWVVKLDNEDCYGKAYFGDGIIMNLFSLIIGFDINGLFSKEVVIKVFQWVEKIGNGKKKVDVYFLYSYKGKRGVYVDRKVEIYICNWIW